MESFSWLNRVIPNQTSIINVARDKNIATTPTICVFESGDLTYFIAGIMPNGGKAILKT